MEMVGAAIGLEDAHPFLLGRLLHVGHKDGADTPDEQSTPAADGPYGVHVEVCPER